MYEYQAKITNIVDGDTFDLDIDLGFHIHLHERIRILDLDTPEKRGEKEKELGMIVTEFAMINFAGADVIIHSKKEVVPKTDSFGRWLVEVIIQDGKYAGRSVADIYTELGVNKRQENYSEESVRRLSDYS